MTAEEIGRTVTQAMKDHHREIAKQIASKWPVPPEAISDVLAGATFGLGVVMLFESGYTQDQIIEIANGLLKALSALPGARGAS